MAPDDAGSLMSRALAPDVSTWPDDNPQLIGSRCDDCGATTWPQQSRCPRCSEGNMSELLLPRRGPTTKRMFNNRPFPNVEVPAGYRQIFRNQAWRVYAAPGC